MIYKSEVAVQDLICSWNFMKNIIYKLQNYFGLLISKKRIPKKHSYSEFTKKLWTQVNKIKRMSRKSITVFFIFILLITK